MAQKGKIIMAGFKDFMKSQTEKTEKTNEKFEGYWKDNPNLSLATFKPVDKEGNDLDKELQKVGWDARNGLNKTLLELFAGNKNIIPQAYTEAGKNDIDRISEDAEFKNKNTFPVRATVTVEYAKYTNDFTGKDGVEHKKGDPIMKKDGTQAINAKAEYSMGKDVLSISLTNKGEITDLTARTGIQKGVSPTFVKKDDLANSDMDKKLKALAAAIIDGGYVKTFEPRTQSNENKDKPKGMSPRAKLFNVYEYMKMQCGYVKGEDGKDNYDNAIAFVKYNKEEEGHAASVTVNYDVNADVKNSLTIGISHGDFYVKSTELTKNEQDKYVKVADGEFINSPADIADYPAPIKEAVTEFLGFENALYKASKEISATMDEKDPDGKPVVTCVYHNGRDNLYVNDKAADNAIEINADGKVNEIVVTAKGDQKEYSRKEIESSALTGAYKQAYDKADAFIKEKTEKEKGQEYDG